MHGNTSLSIHSLASLIPTKQTDTGTCLNQVDFD